MGTDMLARKFMQHSDTVLSVALLAAGVAVIIIALSPADKWVKALALAYVILP